MKSVVSLTAVVIVSVSLLFWWGCSGDDTSTDGGGDPVPEYQFVTSDTIDASGGSIVTGAFGLDIPSGALTGSSEVSLYVSAGAKIFDDNGVTPTYRIDGLPAATGSSLRLRLQYTGTLVEESFVVLGYKTYVPSLGDTVMGYRLLPAEDSSGWLVCDLPADDTTLAAGKRMDDDSAFERFLKGTTEYKTWLSPNFYWVAPEYLWSVPLTGYLEESYNTFVSRGCSFEPGDIELFTGKINACIEKDMDPPDARGYARVQIFAGKFVSAVDFNAYYMNPGTAPELPDYGPLVGRTVFDHIPYSYQRPYGSPAEHWLHKAFAVWCEELFTTVTGYIPEDFAGHEMEPFTGLRAGAGTNLVTSCAHGYGCAAVIKYMTDIWKLNHEDDNLGLTYSRMMNGINPTTALLMTIDDNVHEWWPEFCEKYVEGDIYDVPIDTFVNHTGGVFWINGDNDTLTTFTAKYPDLSAKLYAVNLGYDMNDRDSLVIDVTGSGVATGEATALLFEVKQNSSRRLYNGSHIVVHNVQGFRDAGYQLMVAVVNSRNVAPYTDSTNITLTLKRRNETNDISEVAVTLGSVWVDLAFSPDTCSGFPGSSSNFWAFSMIYGTMSDDLFVGTRDYTTSGIVCHDSVSVTLNTARTSAAVYMSRARYDAANHFVDTLRMSASGIAATTPDDGFDLKFLQQGTAVCTNVQLYYRRVDDDIACDYVIGSYHCDQFTQLVIHMR